MPNHIDNNVLIIASDELVKQIRDEIRGDEIDGNTGETVCIDFDKIIPIPKELEGTSSPAKIITQYDYDRIQRRKTEIQEILGRGEVTDEQELRKLSIELEWECTGITLEMSQEFKRKFGYDNWYDWRVQNTGTKWGAYSCVGGDHSENNFFFQTAWAHPEQLMRHLSVKYPEAIFVSTFADEDTGSNCGVIAYKDGEVNFEDGSVGNHDRNFGTAFALSVQYGEDVEEQVEQGVEDEWIEQEDAEKIIKILNSGHQLIKVAKDLNEENAKFLTNYF